MRRATLLAGVVAIAQLGLSPGAVRADVFGPIALVSKSSTQQADYAHDPAISGNGRYLAFAGQTGVFRRDLLTGAVEDVAAGEAGSPAGSAALPSISASGRFVSFTTTAQLVPGDTNEGPDVYVRDVAATPPAPQYALGSAVDGSSEEALSYQTKEPKRFGSVAAGRSALSADGTRVVFVTSAISNLSGEETPALQVAVRDLGSDRTQLLSVALGGGPVSGVEGTAVRGGVYAPGNGAPPFERTPTYGLGSTTGASISADGSTVAWMGQDVSAQAPALSGEVLPPRYSEPLWRRIAGGPTRRITGGSDPANPDCAARGETSLPGGGAPGDPCQGPFLTFSEPTTPGIWQGRPGDPVPRLSADGSTVAFLSQARPVTSGNAFGELFSDLYVADMSGGLSRVAASRPLTELASGDVNDPATTAPLIDLGISPDGMQVAFTTQRTAFPLGSPGYVTAPAGVAGMAELFDVDLDNDTLTRVSHGFEGGPGEHPHGATGSGRAPYGSSDGALSPSFSSDGNTLAFSSTASNLVYGDGNTPPTDGSTTFDGSDAFTVARVLFIPEPTPQQISAAPAGPSTAHAWLLGVTARSRVDGTVALDVRVPGAGKLRAGAASAVRVRVNSRARGAHGAAGRGHSSAAVRTRTVAASTKTARGGAGGFVTLVLTLQKPYKALALKRGGLSSTVNVTFAAAGHRLLRKDIAVSFRRTAKPARRAARKAGPGDVRGGTPR
jgi:hypothetical protein